MPVQDNKKAMSLSLAALGIVYGDLGTSPIYALQQTLPHLALNTGNILGVLSLVFWSLILVISTRYVTVFLSADNEGEGGILALVSLLRRQGKKFPRIFFLIGVVGAGLLIGDGMLTPAISVISAVEGLRVISPGFSYLVVPISFTILLVLFYCQRFGTAKIGFSFGPIILCWFITIAVLGLRAIIKNPEVLRAINPYYAYAFFREGGWHAYVLLSGIFLVITGAEAMYADLGHFGRLPIRIGWFAVALPALLLNYFGQGANLLQSPAAISHSFYALAPSWFAYPLLILATLATIIASQAVISASFSLARQAILLNICPRLSIIHTSVQEKGQIYMPQINFILAVGTLILVVIFQSSDALAAAFGMSVNLVMIIVAFLVMCVAHLNWKWSIGKVIRVFAVFSVIDLVFLGANLHKIEEGAWIPLVFAALASIIMITWEKGMNLLRSSYYMNKGNLIDLLADLKPAKLNYLDNVTAIFITDPYDKSGGSFLHYLKLNRIMPEQVVIISTTIEDYPYIHDSERYELKKLGKNIYTLTLHYGFMQTICIPRVLQSAHRVELFPFEFEIEQSIYFVEAINLSLSKKRKRLYLWQKRLFSFLLRNSELDVDFFKLPNNKAISIGTYCEI
ncbi:potassium transport protein Kup [Legionella massiliensis]|uniref:Probable potassium transport system protein Kup n=1 Tax=Legionella massiliensis TaxID=1034943 RepID=A0A078KW65_9GAMM|nr:KUP/HAK/KT family potassium transporter [Legionella massiliensis]CDZ75918.1 potassium transport protein Kup [Legionella massiliensis]CEE11656.1 Low affinity potassium transport system protein kup [Legionella massiliensis]